MITAASATTSFVPEPHRRLTLVDERSEVVGGGDPDGFAGGAGVLPRGIDERSEAVGGGDPDGFAGGAGGLPRGIDRKPAAQLHEMPVVFDCENVEVYYGAFRAVRGVTLRIQEHQITAFIGPSGCGKTTMLRTLNRMHDVIPGARVAGRVSYHGLDLYAPEVSATEVRRRIGMVFQKPNPFPKSIYDNIAFGPRINGVHARADLDAVVEKSLRSAALWDEVKDRLKHSALGLSGGQQQRLCIARTIAVEPEVVLMDEPCSALDPIATARIEELMRELKSRFTIVIVTHNMQQAARVSDRTAFFTTELDAKRDRRTGTLVEYDATSKIFSAPSDERTENYITGRFG